MWKWEGGFNKVPEVLCKTKESLMLLRLVSIKWDPLVSPLLIPVILSFVTFFGYDVHVINRHARPKKVRVALTFPVGLAFAFTFGSFGSFWVFGIVYRVSCILVPYLVYHTFT